MGDKTCHQQCPAVFRTGPLFILSRGNRNRAFPPPYKQSAPSGPIRAVRCVNYLYERISRVICIFPPQSNRAQIPHTGCIAQKNPNKHYLYALRCQSAQHYWYAIVPSEGPISSVTERKIRVFGTVSAIHTPLP